MFSTYMVLNKQEDTFTMCADEISMKHYCQDLEKKKIGYVVERHEVDLAAMSSGNALPKITTIKEWDPD